MHFKRGHLKGVWQVPRMLYIFFPYFNLLEDETCSRHQVFFLKKLARFPELFCHKTPIILSQQNRSFGLRATAKRGFLQDEFQIPSLTLNPTIFGTTKKIQHAHNVHGWAKIRILVPRNNWIHRGCAGPLRCRRQKTLQASTRRMWKNGLKKLDG